MLKVNILAVGKIKEKYLQMGIDEFIKRLTPYAKVNIIEVDDERIPSNPSAADIEIVKKKEAEKILKRLSESSYKVVLAIQGKLLSSEAFADQIENIMIQGHSEVTFIIGGAVGLHDSILKKANLKLSFSKMTFTHQMIRMILLEQVYRGFRIMRGEPYHK